MYVKNKFIVWLIESAAVGPLDRFLMTAVTRLDPLVRAPRPHGSPPEASSPPSSLFPPSPPAFSMMVFT